MNRFSIFWFRRDLRLYDNRGLWHALSENQNVIPLFIFDTGILDELNRNDARVEFIYNTISEISERLKKAGKSLLVLHGNPLQIFRELAEKFSLVSVYTNRDHEPYGIERDKQVEIFLQSKGISFRTFTDHLLFEKGEILSGIGKPYTVYTPFSKKCLEILKPKHYRPYPSEELLHNLSGVSGFSFPTFKELGFVSSGIPIPPTETQDELIAGYHETRDLPYLEGTSRLGIHLRFGTISIRRLFEKAMSLNPVFTKELLWREFFAHILWHFPHVVHQAFKPQYDNMPWRNNKEEFELWKAGKTGFPIVDAGMRQLKETGFMHNRVRMIVASFLTKHLLIDWRWGEAWFAENLLDYELSSNNGNWQWSAGTGCDAAPWFRIFNPTEQQWKFDPQAAYIHKWLGKDTGYKNVKPVVGHRFARERCLSTYKYALSERN
jgi:deoxyribodipyrimidine photo-lyase